MKVHADQILAGAGRCDVVARLRQAAEKLRRSLGAPGVIAAAALGDEEPVVAAVGMANVEAGTALNSRHRMLGGSTGKSFVAATALALSFVERLDLDAPISTWLGARSWFARIPNARALTLRMLLRHAGGVPDHMGARAVVEFLEDKLLREGPDAYLTPEEAVGFVLDAAPVNAPDAGFFYADTNYVLAALVMEAAARRDLYELVDEYVLRPFGMSATEPAVSRRISDLASPYLGDVKGGVRAFLAQDGALRASPRTEWAGGGFVTTARDLCVFVRRYAGGSAFERDYRGQMLDLNKYSWSPGQIGGYGLGLFAARSRFGLSLGHGGYFPGYQSQMLHFPEIGVSVAFQANVSSAFDSYSRIVDDRLAAAQSPPADDAELTIVNDACTQIAAAVVDA